MASTAGKSEVKLWHFKSDMRPYKYSLHKGAVNCCQFANNGKILATGGQDGKVFLWRTVVEGNRNNTHVTAHSAPVKSVRFSYDDRYLLTAGDDKIIKLWEIKNSFRKIKFLRSFLGHTNWVLKADLSPDSTLIASICDKTVRIWQTFKGDQVMRFRNVEKGNSCLEFHPQGSHIAIGGHSGLLQIMDSRTNKLSQIYETGEPINQLNFHPNGQFVACAFDYNPCLNNSVLKVFLDFLFFRFLT